MNFLNSQFLLTGSNQRSQQSGIISKALQTPRLPSVLFHPQTQHKCVVPKEVQLLHHTSQYCSIFPCNGYNTNSVINARLISSTTSSVPPRRSGTETDFASGQPVMNVISNSPIFLSSTFANCPRSSPVSRQCFSDLFHRLLWTMLPCRSSLLLNCKDARFEHVVLSESSIPFWQMMTFTTSLFSH